MRDPDEFSYGGDSSDDESWGNDYEEDKFEEMTHWEPEQEESW